MSSVSGIYRQKKNTTAKSSKSSTKQPNHGGSVVSQPPSLSSHSDGYSESETKLRQFDMDMTYGPCIGMTRKKRWERAQKFGMNPPIEIKMILDKEKVQSGSLWDSCI
ncbi:hypothetical protein RIF29_24297 [Crotalaria pallida]|uniref:DNA polymerase delta subunit 4 n=1 Tax=Crotalaria pallida TaxID=3830 RepID=A0AAN9I013_CROPI